MDHFANQVEGMREKMFEQHKLELRTLERLDQAVIADDVALREELRGIRERRALRRLDLRAELESFAADLGLLPAPRQVQAVTPPPAELPTIDQALAQLERRPQIAPVMPPAQNYAAAPNVHAVAPRFDGVNYPQYGAPPNADPLPRIVRRMAGE